MTSLPSRGSGGSGGSGAGTFPGKVPAAKSMGRGPGPRASGAPPAATAGFRAGTFRGKGQADEGEEGREGGGAGPSTTPVRTRLPSGTRTRAPAGGDGMVSGIAYV